MHRSIRLAAAAVIGTAVASAIQAGHAKTAKECNDEYATNKAAIEGAGQTKRDFITACWAGIEKVPGGTAATAASSAPDGSASRSPTAPVNKRTRQAPSSSTGTQT